MWRVNRDLYRLPIPPGAAGTQQLQDALRTVIDQQGSAFAPIPVTSPTFSNEYVDSLVDAVGLGSPIDPSVAVVMPTSGSTGRPRGVELTRENLLALTPFVAPDSSWVLALPTTSIGGFNVVVRATVADTPIATCDSVGGQSPFTPEVFTAAVTDVFARSRSVATSLVPAQLRRLLSDDDGRNALRQCDLILVGGAATPQSLRDECARFDIAITTTYGSTETTGGCVFDGRPMPGVTVDIEDSGRIVIGGLVVARGYRDGIDDDFADHRFITQDLGVFVDGSLIVFGRADDVVQVNGVNVSPNAVEAAIAALDDITSVAVLVADRDGEPRLHAFVVTTSSVDVSAIAEHVERTLGRPAKPASVSVLDDLPWLPGGKVDRLALRRRLDDSAWPH